ncbi:MAG TPA: glycerol-3-phosphate dehydrogenase/oxidase [Rhizomicrobium sp.]|nr:glycerol-3-phosphate dehydrogenase/oxidase [Rhizomicrobium sp.]
MRRDPTRLSNEVFDLLVVGGGITGACVARDAALRGLKVALIEKNDFASATSAHNSKLIHGGLRYLRNFELSLVRESLRERRIWQRTAPHLVQPLPFLVPLYNAGLKGRAALAAGLTLYDALSYDRGWLDDPDQRLPGHSFLNAQKAVAREPSLAGPGFEGAFLYYDAQMYAPERLALECILDAAAHGAAVANHVTSDGLLIRNGVVEGAKAHDLAGDAHFDIRAKVTLLAAGPWADIYLAQALGRPASHKILRSKGIHLLVPSMTKQDALTVAAGGGHFFVLPWHGHSLLGTTDTAFRSKPDDVGVTESDIDEFLAFINANLPSANLKRSEVQHWYAGLRPLVDDGSGDTYDASRRAELVDHEKADGLNGLFSAIGGKWTTSRDLAQTTVDTLVAKLGATARPCATQTTPTPGGNIARFAAFKAQMEAEHDPVPNIDHLARMYGTRVREVLTLAGNRPNLRAALSENGDIGAQVLFAIREEAALTLEDVVMRRTCIGQLGDPGAGKIARVADLMASELGWDDARKAKEIASVARNFQLATAPQ